LVNHQAAITQLLFSPDSRILVSGDLRGNVFCWDMSVDPPQGTLVAKKAQIMMLEFSPDGKTLVVGDKEGNLLCFDMTKPFSTDCKTLVGHRAMLTAFSFTPKGNLLVSADSQKGFYLWDLTHPSPVGIPLKGLQSAVRSFTVAPNGDYLAAIDGKGTFLYWNLTSGGYWGLDIFTLQNWNPTASHKYKPTMLFSISPSNPNNLLVSTTSSQLLQTLYLPHPVTDWDVSEDEQILMTCADTMVFCWTWDNTRNAYMLQWINGDALICQNALLNDVKDLSASNVHVFTQLGATKISANVDPIVISNQPTLLSEKEIEYIEQHLARNTEKKTLLKQQILDLNQEDKKLKQKLDSHYQFLLSSKNQKNTNL